MSRLLSSSFARVEKVDSPIGDENGSQVFVSIARTVSRESRFPDRGRKRFYELITKCFHYV